jgi:hypothetical protein
MGIQQCQAQRCIAALDEAHPQFPLIVERDWDAHCVI